MIYSNINFSDSNLTESQLKVIRSEKYPMYVKAGAGTGKTETLIQKIIYILQNHPEISLDNIVIISFTNKATNELKNRLEESLYHKSLELNKSGDIELSNKFKEQAYLVNMSHISTIHSFCENIIRRYGLAVNCSPNHIVTSYSNKAKDIIRNTVHTAFKEKKINEFSEDTMISLIIDLYKSNCSKGIFSINNYYKKIFTPLGILRKNL